MYIHLRLVFSTVALVYIGKNFAAVVRGPFSYRCFAVESVPAVSLPDALSSWCGSVYAGGWKRNLGEEAGIKEGLRKAGTGPPTRTAQQPTAHQLIVIPPSSRHHVAGSPPSDAGDRDAHPLPLRQPPPPPGATAAAGGALPEDGSTREHWCLDLLLSFRRFVYVGIFFFN